MAEEKNLQTDILNDLRSYGKYCECFKIEKCSDNGIPDVFFSMSICGASLVEVKAPGEEPSKIQKYKIDKLNRCGTRAVCISSWEEWVNFKKKIGIFK